MSESAPGESADGSTDNSDKDSSVDCPSCEREFNSEHGVKIHHLRTHGESLSKTKVDCSNCEQEITVQKWEMQRNEHHYCSESCKNEHFEERYSGSKNPSHKGKVTVECEYCGTVEKVWPCLEDKRRFCSKECKANYQSDVWDREDHPSYSGGPIQVTCKHCGQEYTEKQCRKDRTNFCSEECHNQYRRENGTMRGENSPRWKGGHSSERGANWGQQRKKALENDDYRCQSCGIHQEDAENPLNVHHIKPYREFESYKEANKVENLVVLCVDNGCHQKWEGIPVRPQLDD